MTFGQMILKMIISPKAEFHSNDAGAYGQTLMSIVYWIRHGDNKNWRYINFRQFIKANDWELSHKTEGA